MLHDAFSPLIGLALGWGGVSDLLYRKVGNRLVLTLLTVWLLASGWYVWQGGLVAELGVGVLAAVLVLLVGLGLFVVRWVGAGDVKLIAVLCLWFGEQAVSFLLVTSLAGGFLALGLPALRTLEVLLARVVLGVSQGLALRWPGLQLPLPVVLGASMPRGIPYGLAIAIGGAFVLHIG